MSIVMERIPVDEVVVTDDVVITDRATVIPAVPAPDDTVIVEGDGMGDVEITDDLLPGDEVVLTDEEVLNLHIQEAQEREARAAGRTETAVIEGVTPPPARALSVPPPTQETPGNVPGQDVQPIHGESVLHPPEGAETHLQGNLQG